MKKTAIYCRTSTPDQHLENQVIPLRTLAAQRGLEIVREYSDRGISGSKARRPGLDAMMADARRGEFAVVLVAAFDRIARSTKNFLETIEELEDRKSTRLNSSHANISYAVFCLNKYNRRSS